MPKAATPALSDMVSASDISQTSIFANYGDGSGDQCTLGKLPYSHDSDLDVQKSTITYCQRQSVQKWKIKLKAAIICGASDHELVYEIPLFNLSRYLTCWPKAFISRDGGRFRHREAREGKFY